MSNETESVQAPRVRSLTRWGVPFHYGAPVAVAVVGLLLLTAGGTPAWIGGWWLAAALPISIGAFLQRPWFALGPAGVWLLWLIIVSASPADAGLAHTPGAVAIALAIVGAGSTLVAQRAIFPATAREAWEPAMHRRGLVDDSGDNAPDAAADPADASPRHPAFEAGEVVDLTQLTLVSDALDLTAGDTADEAVDDGDTAHEAVDDEALERESPGDESTGDAEASATGVPPKPKPVPPAELPLDADPAPLDEGGHVTEFKAISEADLLAAAEAQAAADQANAEAEAAAEVNAVDEAASADQPGSDES